MPVFSANIKAFTLCVESPRIIHTLHSHTYFVLSRTAVTLSKTDLPAFISPHAMRTSYQHCLLSLGSLMSQEGRKERTYELCGDHGQASPRGATVTYRWCERWWVRGHSDPPVPLTAGDKSPMWQVPFRYQDIPSPQMGNLEPRRLYILSWLSTN